MQAVQERYSGSPIPLTEVHPHGNPEDIQILNIEPFPYSHFFQEAIDRFNQETQSGTLQYKAAPLQVHGLSDDEIAYNFTTFVHRDADGRESLIGQMRREKRYGIAASTVQSFDLNELHLYPNGYSARGEDPVYAGNGIFGRVKTVFDDQGNLRNHYTVFSQLLKTPEGKYVEKYLGKGANHQKDERIVFLENGHLGIVRERTESNGTISCALKCRVIKDSDLSKITDRIRQIKNSKTTEVKGLFPNDGDTWFAIRHAFPVVREDGKPLVAGFGELARRAGTITYRDQQGNHSEEIRPYLGIFCMFDPETGEALNPYTGYERTPESPSLRVIVKADDVRKNLGLNGSKSPALADVSIVTNGIFVMPEEAQRPESILLSVSIGDIHPLFMLMPNILPQSTVPYKRLQEEFFMKPESLPQALQS